MRTSLINRQSLTWTAVASLVLLIVLVGLAIKPKSHTIIKPKSHAAACSQTAAPLCFPASVSPNGRYLLDRAGKPYLIVGDSPHSLFYMLTESEANTYFANRQAHGINAVWIELLCNRYTGCNSSGITYDGIAPFTGTRSNPFADPNPAFFQRVDDMINLAAAHGITVFLDPSETGGWLSQIDQAGATNDFNYGVYLGNRYKNFPNIIWLSGNDFQTWSNTVDDTNVQAIAKGIESVDTNRIQTVELNYHLSSSLDDQTWASIIKLNFAYSYYPTYAEVLHAYNQSPNIPVFMGEANYENENYDGHETGGPYVLRLQEYWTMTSGATGQLYGDHDTWDDGTNWDYESKHLDTAGAAQLDIMQAFFSLLAWYNLVPDQTHSFLRAGYGTFSSTGYVQGNDYVTAALTSDGTTGVIYLPTPHTITVDLSKMTGRGTAKWFDPTNGNYTTIGTFVNSGTQQFTSPAAHSDGFDDWILLLQTAPAPTPTITPTPASTSTPTPTATSSAIPSGKSAT